MKYNKNTKDIANNLIIHYNNEKKYLKFLKNYLIEFFSLKTGTKNKFNNLYVECFKIIKTKTDYYIYIKYYNFNNSCDMYFSIPIKFLNLPPQEYYNYSTLEFKMLEIKKK